MAWISFGPKNATCSQNSLDWLIAAAVQHGVRAMCPGPGSSGPWSPSQMSLLLHCCFQQQEMRLTEILRTLHGIRCSGGWSLWRQISNDVGQHISTSVVEYYSVIQGPLTGLRCRDSINVLCKPWDQVPHFAGQQCHSSQSSGHHRFLAAHSPDLAQFLDNE